jgi:hypothetical protein
MVNSHNICGISDVSGSRGYFRIAIHETPPDEPHEIQSDRRRAFHQNDDQRLRLPITLREHPRDNFRRSLGDLLDCSTGELLLNAREPKFLLLPESSAGRSPEIRSLHAEEEDQVIARIRYFRELGVEDVL